jgi:putative transposase
VLKTFKYRIHPTKKQERLLQQTLDECCWLYNHFLEQRKTSWQERQQSINYHAQAVSIPKLKQSRPALAEVHSQVLQNVAVRIDLAFKAFFRRVHAGEEPGYPRFRGQHRYDSFTYPQVPSGCKVVGGVLQLSKIGHVRIVLHRPIEGTPKTCTIRRTSTGKWFACFSCEVAPQPLPESVEAMGVDVGLESFAMLSTGEPIENPRFFRRDEKDLARAQRKLSKAEKGTPERAQRRKVVTRIHERIVHRRSNFAHQEARKLVDRCGTIAIEDLSVNQMVHNRCLAKSIMDAAWSQFAQYLAYKAEEADRRWVRVNPAYTSQDCRTAIGVDIDKPKSCPIVCINAPVADCKCTETTMPRSTFWLWGYRAWRLAPRSPRIHSWE